MAGAHLHLFRDLHEHASDTSSCYSCWKLYVHHGSTGRNKSYLQVGAILIIGKQEW